MAKQLGNHEAAVKALAFNPKKKNILVSGSGTADRKLRIFDTKTFSEKYSIDSGSQVCNLTFDNEGEKLLSTHGYSLNQIIIWDQKKKDFEEIEKKEMLIAHKLRVLYLANSPCGRLVVTGAGDETLRIWDVFRPSKAFKRCMFDSAVNSIR
jgi:cell division cycle 20-like protein 1 (cofactor of APC complex)